jgi:hypothetical protein
MMILDAGYPPLESSSPDILVERIKIENPKDA